VCYHFFMSELQVSNIILKAAVYMGTVCRGKMNNLGAYIRLTADLSMSYNFFLEADHEEEQAAPEEKKRIAPIRKARIIRKK
jgi:hypothetical protein